MARKRRRKPKTYKGQMLVICNRVMPLHQRIVALFQSCDWTSPSWRRDVLALSRAYGAMVQALLSLSAPEEHHEQHVAMTRTTRSLADALESVADLVVEDEADFDLGASQEALRSVTTACVAQSVTAAALQKTFNDQGDDSLVSESPPIVA